MLRKIIPILLALTGLFAGIGVGLLFKTTDELTDLAPGDEVGGAPHLSEGVKSDDIGKASEYVKMSNQFIVPVLREGKVTAMVILTLSIEVKHGTTDLVYAREPKLRDALLQVLFDHANSGGFKGDFTDSANLIILRAALKEIAQNTIGNDVIDVLVTDLARQDS